MGPCKVSVTETCMNHGALQGTCHWDLYEPWGPARYLSLRLVWTIEPARCCHWDLYEPWGPAEQTHKNRLYISVYADGSWWWLSITLSVFTVSLPSMTMTRISFPDGCFHYCHVQTNQPTKQPTNEPDPLSALLQYTGFSQSWQLLSGQDIISAFTKCDSSSALSQNPTLYPHIEPGEYNPQPKIYLYNTELLSPPSKHHFPAGKFLHFLNRNVSAILNFSTQATISTLPCLLFHDDK